MHVQLYNTAKCGRYFIDVLSIFQSSGKLSPPHFSAQFTSKASFPLSSSFPLQTPWHMRDAPYTVSNSRVQRVDQYP